MINILKARNITNKSVIRLCYLIAVIHSIITIRGKFAPNGFIRDYNYTSTDVEQAIRIISKKLDGYLQ